MPKRDVQVLLIALSSPILIGIYEDNKLIKTIQSEEKSSEVLPQLYKDILERYEIKALYYTQGPGSFMAIKVAYIFLKSLSVLKKIPFYATDAFEFNENQPIKAIGKLYFVKIKGDIVTQKFESPQEVKFTLPQTLKTEKFSLYTAPLYKIGAVG
jgi:tRNA A37 threonylcarbamoyladenosine modification protein TsaB